MAKSYCTLHGTAQFEGESCTRCKPSLPKHYANIVLTSATQLRLSRGGEPMPGIYEVISVHVVDTLENIYLKRGALQRIHAAPSEMTLP